MKRFLLIIGLIASFSVHGQHDAVYYAGINPISPFTGVRSHFAGGTLPAMANLESGVSFFTGKIWNSNYNVETRVSNGSPIAHTRQFLVQSGMLYCFNQKQPALLNSFYAGLFVRLEEMNYRPQKEEKSAVILYWSAGRRFAHGRWFADVRVNQHVAGIKWSRGTASKASAGFHPPIYNWNSPYVPFAGISLGYVILSPN